MSIATMIGLGVRRQWEKTEPQAAAAAGGDETVTKTAESAMEKVSAFIPSEVIGIYIAGLGILSPTTDAGKWWIFGVSLALIPIVMLLNYLIQKKRADTPLGPRASFILFIFAVAAFVAWAAALPSTPFLSLSEYATNIGGWSVIILAAVMYKAAEFLDIVPKPS